MDILIRVIGQRLKLQSNQKSIVYGSTNFIRLVFSVSNNWVDLDLYVRLSQGENVYDIALDENNSCYVPSAIGVGKCEFTLYGTSGSGGSIKEASDVVELNIKDVLFTPLVDR